MTLQRYELTATQKLYGVNFQDETRAVIFMLQTVTKWILTGLLFGFLLENSANISDGC